MSKSTSRSGLSSTSRSVSVLGQSSDRGTCNCPGRDPSRCSGQYPDPCIDLAMDPYYESDKSSL